MPKKRFSIAWLAVLTALALCRTRSAEAQGCIVTTPLGAANDEARAVVLQADGKIVVAGFSFNGANDDFAIVRYNPDLSLDSTFGTGGIVTTAIGPGSDRALDVAIQSDGKIVVVGSVFTGSFLDFGVVRYNANGSLDTSFGGTGIVLAPVGPLDDEASSVAIQSDGRIVVAGFSQNGADYDFAVVRYDATGSLDFSFDFDGMVTTAFGAGSDLAEDVAIQVDGNIVVAGYSYNTDYDFAVARYLPDGTLDSAFDVDGRVTTPIGLSDDLARAMAIQPDGRIVLAGSSSSGGGDDFALVRYNSDGSLDPLFDGDGKVVTAVGAVNDSAQAVAIQPDGKILTAGVSDTTLGDLALTSVRYNIDGSLDLAYDGDGRVTTPIGAGNELGYGVAVEPLDGEILVAGTTAVGATNDFTVVRYESDGTLDCSRVYLHPTGPGSVNAFTNVTGCAASWDCVNDQPGNLGFGAPVIDLTFATYLQDANGSTNSEAFSLDDATVPAGATISAIRIEAQVGAGGGPSPKIVRLSYRRIGYDPVPVLSPAMTVTSSCCTQSVSWSLGGLAWTSAQLDALEIGIVHDSGGVVEVSQIYVSVRYVAPTAQVNYRSIGTRLDYGTAGPEGAGTTVAALNGSDGVTGASTTWKTANRGRGDRINIDGFDYTILSVDSDTRLTLASPFTGASGWGKPYAISREFLTLQAWEDAREGNLVFENRVEVGIAYNDSVFTAGLVINGSMTNARHEITLTADGANRHFGIPGTGVIVDNPSAVLDAIEVRDDFVTLEWLELRGGAGVVNGVHVESLGTSNDIVLSDLLVHDVPGNGFHLNDPSMDLLAYDNVIYNAAIGIEIGTSATPEARARIFNNTVYNASDRGIVDFSASADATLINNIAAGSGVQDFDLPGLNGASSNNLATDGTAGPHSPGGGGLDVSVAAIQFVSPATGNLHILPGSAALNVGADLSATFTLDIDGGARFATWDIGADEAGAPGSFRVHYRSIGTASYGGGSVTVLNGSSVVAGSGTFWLTANRGAGDRITIQGQDYSVLSVDSESQLTLESPYTGPPGTWTYSMARAFPTLQAWESARQGDLVGENRREVGVAYKDSVFTSGVVISGSTTDQSHFLTLTVAARNRHSGIAGSGALVDGLNAPSGEVLVDDDFTVVEWLEVKRVRGGTVAGVRVLDSQNVRLAYLLAHDNRLGVRLSGSGGKSFTIQNSIVYKNDLDGIEGDEVTDSVTVENCTLFGNGQRGVDDAAGTFFSVTNTIAVANLTMDFDIPGGLLSYSLSSDGTATGAGPLPFRIPTDNPNPPPGDWVVFRSLLAGNEDLHLQLVAENDAVDSGATLSPRFWDDVDGVSRTGSWDRGADEASPVASGVDFFSMANQSFVVGSLPTAAAQMVVQDFSGLGGAVNAVDDIRVRIPAGFHMRWDTSVKSVSLGGGAASKMSAFVKAYEDGDATVVLDVLTDFLTGDTVTVDGLGFRSFTAPSPLDHLELETGNDDLVSDLDETTIVIRPAAIPTLSSELDQNFLVGGPSTSASAMFVTDGATPSINAANDIRIRIPSGFNMRWDVSIASALVGGPGAGKVASSVLYEDFGRTLVLSVLQSFAPGEYVSISGLAFKDFIAPSPSDNLELEVGNDDLATDSDDKSVTIVPVWDLQVLTARATHLEVKLEWVNPPVGACDSVLILARTDTYPTSPFDVLARLVGNPGCTLGATDFLTDSVPDDVTQFYTAWVYDAVSDGYSFGKLVKARAFDSVPGPVKWAYSTGASSMAPPGLRFQGASSYVYAVSNDSILHSLNGDASGGDWPSTWTPFRLGAPAQARPPVVSIPVGGATGAAFLGSQDGAVYAVDAQSGAPEWSRTIATMVQAAPVGNFLAFDATASNLILVGTRNSSLPNSLEALDVDTGLPAWSFTNSVSQGGNGKGIGIISGGATVHYASKRLYFASRVRTSGSSDTLWCVDFSSGSPTRAWSLPLGNIDGSPVLYGGVVYVGTNAGVVHAVDASGAPLWSLALGDGPIKGFVFPQFGSSNVFVSTNGKVWSLAAGAPNPGWPVTIPSPSIPLYVPGTMRVLVGSSNGRLYQMDAVTPTPTESVLLGDGAGAVGAPSLNVKNSLVYVGTDGGIIYAVEFPLP